MTLGDAARIAALIWVWVVPAHAEPGSIRTTAHFCENVDTAKHPNLKALSRLDYADYCRSIGAEGIRQRMGSRPALFCVNKAGHDLRGGKSYDIRACRFKYGRQVHQVCYHRNTDHNGKPFRDYLSPYCYW